MAKVGGLFFELSANVARLQSDLNKGTAMLDKFARNANAIFGGLGAGIAGAGVIAFIKNITSMAGDLKEVADSMGMTTQELQRWQAAGSQVGLTAETMQKSIAILAKNAYEASDGVSQMAEKFQHFGIKVTTAKGELKTTDELLMEIADKFAKMPDSIEKTAMARELLGRGFAKFIPLLNQGSQGLQEFMDRAEAMGLVLSEEDIAKWDDFGDTMTILVNQGKMFCANVLAPMAQLLTEVGKVLGGVFGVLKGFFNMLMSVIEAIKDSVKWIVENVPDWLKPGPENPFGNATGPAGAGEGYSDEYGYVVPAKAGKGPRERGKAKPAPFSTTAGHGLAKLAEDSLKYEEALIKKANDIRKAELESTNKIAMAEAERAVKMGVMNEADRIRLETKQKIAELDDQYLAIAAQIDNADLAKRQELEGQLHVIERQKTTVEELGKIHADYAEYMVSDLKRIQDAGKAAFQSMEDSLVDFCTTGEFNFRNMIQGMLRELNKLLMATIANKISGSLGGSGSGGFAGLFGDLTSGNLNAGFYQDLGIGGMGIGFAKGGIIHRPTVFPMAGGMGLMGEAGPEAVMPLQRDGSGNLGVAGAGGGGGTTIIIQANDAKSFADMCARNPNAIIGPIDKALKGNSGLRQTIRQTR